MTAPLLAVQGLVKRFGGLVAVDEVDMVVAAGSIHALIGPNGAGKTTMLNLLTRILRPDAGRIRYAGDDLLALPPHALARRGIGRIFQHVELFGGLSVLENVLIGAHQHGRSGLLGALLGVAALGGEERALHRRARDALEFVGLADFAARPAAILTGGQARLVGLARALAGAPRLLLLDELVAGMNSQEGMEAAGLVRRLRDQQGMTIILIEHDMRFVMDLADRITVLNFGRRIAEGLPEEVMRDPGVIEAYLGRGASVGQAHA